MMCSARCASRAAKRDDPSAPAPATEVIKSCRFLGRAEVALGQTLDVPAGTPLWFPLMRRGAADAVSGQLQLRFVWDVTARGLLTIKLAALERVLAQRREILAALQPVSPEEVLAWMRPPEPATPSGSKADRGVMGTGVSLFGVDPELGVVGAGEAGGLGGRVAVASGGGFRAGGGLVAGGLARLPLLTREHGPLALQAAAGRCVRARWRPRCWRATRTTTISATSR